VRIEIEPWSPVPTSHLVGVAAFAAAIVIGLLAGDPGWTPILDSANLAFHEAGHHVYGIFGTTAQLYGGLLGQMTFPLVAAAIFFFRREPAGVATTLIWASQNLFSIGRYMADARARELPLVGGTEHDFENIFTRWGVLDRDVHIAAWTRNIGWLAMIACLAWLAWRWHRDRRETDDEH
jgi:hypothetical protein